MRVNKLILTLAMVGLSSGARADDGSWNRTYDLAQGPLYSVTENPDISLDKELLVLEDFVAGTVTARFEFRNTSDRAITLDAGFPVVLDLQLGTGYERGAGKVGFDDEAGKLVYLLPVAKYGGEVDPDLLRAAGLVLRKRTRDADDDWELGDFYIRAADFTKKRLERPVPKRPPFDFTIEQDGKKVALTSMVVELDPAGKPPIVFNFRHQLRFAPGATSLVSVRYSSPTLEGGMADSVPLVDHEWHYILRTGATWKGKLGKLVLAVPLGGKCAGEDKWTKLGKWGGYQLYARTRFEPTAEDDIRCKWQRFENEASSWDDFWFDDNPRRKALPWAQARQPAPDVRAIRASSEVKYEADIYTEARVVKNVPTSAAAAFDGIVESAWSEGDKQADVGQYLEFELTQPAAGLRIMAGFLGALHPVSGDLAGKKKQKLLANLYADNSRPKLLELSAIDGSRKWTLELKDKKATWNVFPILVPAGKYRLVIRKTYRGKRWQDTSIGEIVFNTGPTTCLDRLRKDRFFAGFFADGAPYLHPFASTPSPDDEE